MSDLSDATDTTTTTLTPMTTSAPAVGPSQSVTQTTVPPTTSTETTPSATTTTTEPSTSVSTSTSTSASTSTSTSTSTVTETVSTPPQIRRYPRFHRSRRFRGQGDDNGPKRLRTRRSTGSRPRRDPDAAGGAITVALCGHWDTNPPARLHRTTRQRCAEPTTQFGYGCCSPSNAGARQRCDR